MNLLRRSHGRARPFELFRDDCRRAGLFVGALVAGVLLMACSDAKPVGFYTAHDAARAARVQACLQAASDSQDCVNGRQADFEVRGIPAADGRALPRGRAPAR